MRYDDRARSRAAAHETCGAAQEALRLIASRYDQIDPDALHDRADVLIRRLRQGCRRKRYASIRAELRRIRCYAAVRALASVTP